MWTREKVASTIDHAALKPSMTEDDIRKACAVGKKFNVATVCVRPSDVKLAAAELKNSNVGVSAVVGFPHGANRSEVKALEAGLAIQDGAVELDMVMNIGMFLSGNHQLVKDDIRQVVAAAGAGNVPVKVIFEVCYLSNKQIAAACALAEEAGAQFVKTSTGFGESAATPESVEIMVRAVGNRLGVKAAGGIRDWATAVGFLEQGCVRLGAGSTEAILSGATSTEDY